MQSYPLAQARQNNPHSQYIDSLQEKHTEITTCWMLAQQQQWQGEPVEKLRQIIWQLAEASASCGFSDISAAAYKVENHLLKYQPSNRNTLFDLQHSLQSLCSLLTIHARGEIPDIRISNSNAESSHQENGYHRVLIFDPEPANTQHLQLQLLNRGYKVSLYTSFSLLKQCIAREKPAICLFNITSLADDDTLLTKITAMMREQSRYIPLIALVDDDNFKNRLVAARLQATICPLRTVRQSQILHLLDDMLELGTSEPYRIMVVGDDSDTTLLYQTALEQAGMCVTLLYEVEKLMEMLVENQPELILMNVHLYNCNSFDLAALIRLEDAYMHIPVIFLTTDSTPKQSLMTLNAGSDDFLLNPVSPEYLTQLISTRIQYTRRLKRFIPYDGLSGFLNLPTFAQHLLASIANAERSGYSIAVAIIDVDNFKHVNQHYGYWIGNIILKQIADTLKQRLRRSDLLGRYHDDSFIVALNDADQISAQQVLERLVNDIARLAWHVEGETFHITLSVGIARYPGHIPGFGELENDIFSMAEQALWQARKQGRNQVAVLEND